MIAAKVEARIRARAKIDAAAAPPFTDDQRAAIVRILGPVAREMAAERAAKLAAPAPRRRRGGAS